MKVAGEDNLIEELFRHKLENAELMPSLSVRAGLMRRLAVREFFRFNPGRFNVYYLAGIVIAVSVAVIVLSDRSEAADVRDDPSPVSVSSGQDIEKIENSDSDRNKGSLFLSGLKSGLASDEKSARPAPEREVNQVTEISNGRILAGDHGKISDISGFRPEINLCERVSSTQAKIRETEENTGRRRIDIEASLLSGCAPLLVRFNTAHHLYDSCLWSFGDGEFSSELSPARVYTAEGDYSVILRVFDRSGKETGTGSAVITVYPKPSARFEIQDENGINSQGIRFINFSNNAVRFRWDFGDGTYSELYEPVHTYMAPGNYNIRLIAISEHGCSDSVKITGSAGGSGYFVVFPNAFIPNPGGPSSGYYTSSSDESSTIFHPVARGVSEYQLRIYSKRGILIFESNDINIGWDGYLNGQMCEPGVYVWKASGRYLNGQSFTKIGDVTLLRGTR